MGVKILILDFDAFFVGARDLRFIWARYITAKWSESAEVLVDILHIGASISKRNFLRLFNLVMVFNQLYTRYTRSTIEEEELRTIENIKRVREEIREEMESIWSTIDTRVIDSFKDLIRNVTGSDELADIYRREVERANILNSIRNAKYEHDYREMEHIICEQLYETTVRWFQEIKRLAGI
ncbi:MAG: hypothetical protein N2V75_00380 [Methanophagales archaeon]|nr:hypothetical protein [Methanophagales archaeon]